MKYQLRIIIAFLLCVFSTSSWAILHLVLTQAVDAAIPITVVPFAQANISGSSATKMDQVIAADLRNSGRFTTIASNDAQHQPHQPSEARIAYWRKQNVNYLVVGSVAPAANGQYTVKFSLLDVYKRNKVGSNPILANHAPILLSQMLTVPLNQLRAVAHHLSDLIYQQIIGERGVFSTKIAYVLLQRATGQAPLYQLIIADYDGFNPQPILVSHRPIMSPAWSADGKQLAYVSFENGFPAIYISNIANGQRRLITRFRGINGAPAFSPDGKQLAVALSKDGSPNIYLIDLHSGQIEQLTHSYAINTEPSWSPDGQSLLFTSDRGGTPQIYRINLQDKKIKRLTFSGNYNVHAKFTPDGQSLVLLHRGADTEQQFGVALQDLNSSTLQVLASDNDQSPSLAPNSSMIIYARQNTQRQGELAMVSTDGRVKLQLPSAKGDVREPAWSPFLRKEN